MPLSSDSKDKSPTLFQNLYPVVGAAALSGLPADLFSFPLSRLKTVMMTQRADTHSTPKSSAHVIGSVYKAQGFSGFYRGLSPVMLSAIPGTTLFFTGMHATKEILGDGVVGAAAAGLVGQIAGSLVWVPSEVFKELRQMMLTRIELKEMSVTNLARHVIKTEGVKGMYRGFIPQLLTFGPFNSLGTSLSAGIQNKLKKERETLDWPLLVTSYAVAFGFAAAVTTPIDVIKTQVQVGAANPTLFPNRSILSCAKRIYAQGGVGGFFEGTAFRAGWLGIRQAIAFSTFALAFEAIKKHTEKAEIFSESAGPRV